MHVPDVTDVNGGRMKAEWFPWMTEDLISLFWMFGRKAERGAGKYWSVDDAGGNDDDCSFDLYLSRFVECVCSSSSARHIHKQCLYTYSHLDNRSDQEQDTLTVAIKKRRKSMSRIRTKSFGKVTLLQIILGKIRSLIWFDLWFKCHHYSVQW